MSRRTLILGVGYLLLMLLVAGASYYMFISPGIFSKTTKTTPSIAKVTPVISPFNIADNITLIDMNHSTYDSITKADVGKLATVSGASKLILRNPPLDEATKKNLELISSQSRFQTAYQSTVSAQVIAGRFKSASSSDIVVINNLKEVKLRPVDGTRLYIKENGKTQVLSYPLITLLPGLLLKYIRPNELLLGINVLPVSDYFQIRTLIVFK